MFHVWKLGKRGCQLLVNDFNNFVDENNLSSSQIKENATLYAKESVQRWKNFVKLKTAKVREIAQELNSLHTYDRILTPNTNRPWRSGVSKMAILLSMSEANELVVRHREHWTKTLQNNNAGMFFRNKKEYDWEELPAGQNNRRKEKPKPGTLGERIVFKGEENSIYGKFVKTISNDGTIKEQAILLQRICMKNMPAVGQNFHKYAAEKFLLEIRKQCTGPRKRKSDVEQVPGRCSYLIESVVALLA